MFVSESPPHRPGRQRRTWPRLIGLLLGIGACLLGGNLVISKVLGGSTAAENARDEVLKTEAPQIVRDLEVANLEPGNLGPASVAWLTNHFQNSGDSVLRSSSTPGRPPSRAIAGSLDVRMMRNAEGDALGQPTGSETIPICLRFETTWSDTYGGRTSFREIKCP